MDLGVRYPRSSFFCQKLDAVHPRPQWFSLHDVASLTSSTLALWRRIWHTCGFVDVEGWQPYAFLWKQDPKQKSFVWAHIFCIIRGIVSLWTYPCFPFTDGTEEANNMWPNGEFFFWRFWFDRWKTYSFFVPDKEYCINLEGLLEHLWTKYGAQMCHDWLIDCDFFQQIEFQIHPDAWGEVHGWCLLPFLQSQIPDAASTRRHMLDSLLKSAAVIEHRSAGQIIATSHDLTPKGRWGMEIPLFHQKI